MSHLKAIVQEFRVQVDAAGVRGDLKRAEKRLAELQAKSLHLCEKARQLPRGSSRARVTTANARWARVAEARDLAEREVARLRALCAEGRS